MNIDYLTGFDHPAMPAPFPVEKKIFRDYEVLTDLEPVKDYHNGMYGFQGGCTDGRYLYTLAVWHNDNNAVLQKRELYSMEVIDENSNYNYSHAGGITYCEKDGYLYISHAGGDNRTVSRVDPMTLQRRNTIQCVSNIMNIAYCKEHDLFVASIASPYYFGVYKLINVDGVEQLGLVYHIKAEGVPTGYGKQSIACDKDFIFATFSDCIHVFTWTGEHVRRIEVPDTYQYRGERFEMEWAFIHDDFWHIGVYNGYDNGERYNTIWTKYTSFYEDTDIKNLQGKTGISSLNRLPAGTMVKLYGYETHNGKTPVNLSKFLPYNSAHYKYLKVRYVGQNVGVADWWKSGKLTIREFNLSDSASNTMEFRELQFMEMTGSALAVEQNQHQKITFNDDGTFKSTEKVKESDTMIRVLEIYGVV